jgi:hypothetical protein
LMNFSVLQVIRVKFLAPYRIIEHEKWILSLFLNSLPLKCWWGIVGMDIPAQARRDWNVDWMSFRISQKHRSLAAIFNYFNIRFFLYSKIPKIINLRKEERVILIHGFRSFNPWVLDSVALACASWQRRPVNLIAFGNQREMGEGEGPISPSRPCTQWANLASTSFTSLSFHRLGTKPSTCAPLGDIQNTNYNIL